MGNFSQGREVTAVNGSFLDLNLAVWYKALIGEVRGVWEWVTWRVHSQTVGVL